MLLTHKYAPSSVDAMIGNEDAREHAKQWMLNWIAGKRRKPLLVHGPTGVGKTSLAYALASQYDMEIIEMNASELRNRGRVERILTGATLAGTLSGKGKILLVDDVDALAGRKDSGGSGAIVSVLSECSMPVVVTATDIWDKKLAPVRNACEQLALKKVGKAAIAKLLAVIAAREGMEAGPERIAAIAESCGGDVRSAINDLQAGGHGGRDREVDIFERVRRIFKAERYSEARDAMQGDVDYELVKLWVDENIPNEYEDKADVAAAYRMLSRADIFEGRIRKSNWHLLRYTIDLATAGVALCKARQYRKFTRYNFPAYLKEMSASMARRAMRKKIGEKIGARVHSNRSEALEYVPLIQAIMRAHGDSVRSYYDFDEDELAFIMETSVSRVKARQSLKS